MMQNEVSKQLLPRLKKILLIFVGSLTWSITMIKSGYNYSSLGINGSGLGFWGANGHDGIWHIALAEGFSRGTFEMPIFSGLSIQNYHIGFDLLLAFFHKITFIPIPTLYFQILPPIFAVLIGLLVYLFIWNWLHSAKAAWWSTFFVYFGGSFGWLLSKGESAFWAQQGISTLINPPYALSLIIILIGLLYLVKSEDRFKIYDLGMLSLIFGSLIIVKVYAGALVLGAVFIVGVYGLVLNHKSKFINLFIGTLIFSLIFYLPFNKLDVSLLKWQPFWFLESMMGLTDRIGWARFNSAMLSYKSGHVWGKAVLAYGSAFLIFILGNFGTRIVFIFRKIKLDPINIFIYSIILAGILIPMLFVQTGTPWNTIQFFYYSLFFSSILAGIAVSQIKNKILLALIIAVTIPTTLLTLKDVYIPNRPPAMLGTDETSALNFLSKEPRGIVLTRPFSEMDSKNAENNPPRPLYLYTSTAYVSAFSKHQTYLEDEINLNIMDFDWQGRRKQVLDWYQEKDLVNVREFLSTNNIKYIYWIKDVQPPLDLVKLGLKNIYENNSVAIYRVE